MIRRTSFIVVFVIYLFLTITLATPLAYWLLTGNEWIRGESIYDFFQIRQ
jgi:ammonia channel protein AmtB